MDSSEWELSKENVQPIKQGRKICNLTAALTPSGLSVGADDPLYWKLQKDKQHFEAEIRTYEGDDFLDVWYRYILWTEENVPKGGRDIGTLLERCIKEFQDLSKYENDERYLDVWLKYADCCTDPVEIFNYLYTKGTCSRLALLYIAWASACENVENFQKADQVLMLGIERKAQPLEMLQKHHIGFQHRLTAHIAATDENHAAPTCNQENQRKALGSLITSGKNKIVGVLRTSSSQNPQSRPVKAERKGLGFSILHDSDDSENRMSRLPESRGSEWKEAPTETVMSKENISMPGKWTGEKAHPRRPLNNTVPLVRSAPKQNFQVHVDENADQIGHVPQDVGSQVLSVRKTGVEGSNNPLKVIANSGENSETSNVKVMYDKSKVYAGAEEFQFEEIHAAKYLAMLKQGLPWPKDVNRLKRERNRTVQPEKQERVMYPKNKIYAYEGEFQQEELMARLYYERGSRLRIAKPKKSRSGLSSRIPVRDRSCISNPSKTASDISVHGNGINIRGDAGNVTIHSHAKNTLSSRKTEDFRVAADAENIPPHEFNSRDVTIGKNASGMPTLGAIYIRDDAENIPLPHCKSGGMIIPHSCGVIPPPSNVQNINFADDVENIPPPHCKNGNVNISDCAGAAPLPGEAHNIHFSDGAENIPPPLNNQGITIPNYDAGIPQPTDIRNTYPSDDAENIPPPHRNAHGFIGSNRARETPPLSKVRSMDVPDAHRPDLEKDFTSPCTGPQLRKSLWGRSNNTLEKKSNLQKDVATPKLAYFKPDFTGPSPTLTTKQAFADVMPWFNTTVGLSTSDDELENDFKNDENDDENDDMGWHGIPFGEGFGLKRKIDSDTEDIDNYCSEDQENLPPFGYSQTKVERPLLGVLQPSVGIPFKPLEEFETNEDDKVEVDEQPDNVFSDLTTAPPISMKQDVKPTDDEITRTNWLNHSQFATAARVASTPFVENFSPPKLENLHCSTIQAHDDGQEVSHQDHASNVSSSSYNANNSKGLSPIMECSDEDAKTGSSKGSTSSHSSGMLTKSHAPTTQSFIANQTGTSFVQDKTCQRTQLQDRSMDITVHDINGSVLKKINPFDPELCNQLLAQLPQPVSSFSGYRDLKENVLPKLVTNKCVVIGDEVFKLDSVAGTGAYAKVYSATKVDSSSVNSRPVALKVQRPANDWEFYICFELQKRLKNRGKSKSEIASIVNMIDYYVFADGSCSVSEYCKRGTFLDFVNSCKMQHNLLEKTALYYAIEMMKILECIHDCGIIHGDIKPDNFVLFENHGDEQLCRLGLIDFGCAIDVELFPPGTRFSVDKNTDSFECIEMKTQRPWTTQVDTYGMLCSLHCLVFGDYMNVYQDRKTGRWKPTKSFNRTWNRTLWNKLFDVLLNIRSCDDLPSLSNIRQEFQEYFEYDDGDGKSTCDLRNMIYS